MSTLGLGRTSIGKGASSPSPRNVVSPALDRSLGPEGSDQRGVVGRPTHINLGESSCGDFSHMDRTYSDWLGAVCGGV